MKDEKKECEHNVVLTNTKTREHHCRDCRELMTESFFQPDNDTLLRAIEKLTKEVQILRALVVMPKEVSLENLKEKFKTFTDEERLAFWNGYCKDCGTRDGDLIRGCQCWNDE